MDPSTRAAIATAAARRPALQTESRARNEIPPLAARRGVRKRPSRLFVGGNLSLVPIDHRSNHLLSGMRVHCVRSLSICLSIRLPLRFFSVCLSLFISLRFFLFHLSGFFSRLLRGCFYILTLNQAFVPGGDDTANICPPILYRSRPDSKLREVSALRKHRLP